MFDIILVPQGAEHKAVQRGLQRATARQPLVFPVPIGPKPLMAALKTLQSTPQLTKERPQVLLMGLCGSLVESYAVGDVVVYRDCLLRSLGSTSLRQGCDPQLTTWVCDRLSNRAGVVTALTSDRLVWSATEKRQLGQTYQADVVDMEGFAALEVLNQAGMDVAMVRVVSDAVHHDLPNLDTALRPDGSLQPFLLAWRFLRQPIAATRLIQGSLRALQVLQNTTTHLYSD